MFLIRGFCDIRVIDCKTTVCQGTFITLLKRHQICLSSKNLMRFYHVCQGGHVQRCVILSNECIPGKLVISVITELTHWPADQTNRVVVVVDQGN